MFRLLFEIFGRAPLGLVLFACVGVYLFWVLAYGFVIAHALRTRMYGFPIVAAAVVWSYEFCFIFLWPIAIPWWALLEWVWFLADTILLVQCVAFARRTAREEELQRLAPGVVLWSVVAALVLMSNYVAYYDHTDGSIPAVVAVTAVAILFPAFALIKPGGVHVSVAGACCRVLGDLCTALCVWLLFPFVGTAGYGESPSLNNLFVDAMLVVMLVSDVVLLLYLLTRMPQRRAAHAGT